MSYLLWKNLKTRWPILLAAAAVVGAAVSVLVAQGSMTAAVEAQVHELTHRLGRNMLVVPEGTDLSAFYAQRFDGPGLPADYPERLRASPLSQHIQHVEARLYQNRDIGGEPLILVGEAVYRNGQPSGPVEGEGVLLGQEAARRLRLGAGDTLSLGERPLRVFGVAGNAPEGLEGAAFMRLGLAQSITGRPERIDAMRLGGCWCRVDVPTLARSVQDLLPGTRALTVAGVLAAQQGTLTTVQRYGRIVEFSVLGLVGLVSAVLVAAQVRRQTKGIGLLMAMGAQPGLLVLVFVAEGLVVGVLGAGLGWAAGRPLTAWAGTHFLGLSLTAPLLVPWKILSLVVAVSAAAALVPARRIVRLDPTSTLRDL